VTRHGWPEAPAPVREQVAGLAERIAALLGDALVGVYLHGSLVLGCFNSRRSDVDLIAVTRRSLRPEERAEAGRLLLASSSAPCKVEAHFLTERQLHPWRHPPPFDLHYGESARTRFERGDFGAPSTDRDLAAHVWIARRAAVALLGPPAHEVFPSVPHADYVDALLADLAYCRTATSLDYRVLSASRIWAALAAGGLQSKETGARWALAHARDQFRPLLHSALARYGGNSSEQPLDEAEARAYVSYVEHRVEELNA
jgi:predicted nucleotidyltransferase